MSLAQGASWLQALAQLLCCRVYGQPAASLPTCSGRGRCRASIGRAAAGIGRTPQHRGARFTNRQPSRPAAASLDLEQHHLSPNPANAWERASPSQRSVSEVPSTLQIQTPPANSLWPSRDVRCQTGVWARPSARPGGESSAAADETLRGHRVGAGCVARQVPCPPGSTPAPAPRDGDPQGRWNAPARSRTHLAELGQKHLPGASLLPDTWGRTTG